MKKLTFIISCCTLLFFCACNSQGAEEKQLSDAEKQAIDSVSKVEQKQKGDLLKKKNPLLILPPDSNYTGDYTDKYPSGITKFKGFFRFGKRHGQWLSFYPNGIMWSEMYYDKGIRHGTNTTFFENGKIRYTGFYKNDKQDSVWIYNDTTGKPSLKVVYKNDRKIQQVQLK